MKNLSIIAGIALFGLVGCQQADGKMADAKKIDQMVQVKLDSLRKELAADCDKQIMSAVQVKAAAVAAARAKAAAPVANKPSTASTNASTKGTTTTTAPRKPVGKVRKSTGSNTSGSAQKVNPNNPKNENFNPKKRKLGKVRPK